MCRTSFAALAVACLFTTPLLASDAVPEGRDPRAIEILEQVDAAAKKVESVSYHMVSTPLGLAATRGGPAAGDVVLAGWSGAFPERFFVSVKTTREGRPVEIAGGGNGDLFFLVDNAAKKGYEDMDRGVFGSQRNVIFSVAMVEFVHDTPFADELGAATVRYVGEEDVAGEPCHVIHVVYGEGQEATWSFSKGDLLPRRRIQKFSSPQGEAGSDSVVSNLVVDPEIAASRFVMQLPEGYARIEDFAP